MPASPTDSTSGAARDRAATEAAATDASQSALSDDSSSPAAVKGAVSPASPTSGSGSGGGKASTSAPTCPQCGGSLERYEGENPHKAGTGWCPAEGVRVPLAAQSSASSVSAASAS